MASTAPKEHRKVTSPTAAREGRRAASRQHLDSGELRGRASPVARACSCCIEEELQSSRRQWDLVAERQRLLEEELNCMRQDCAVERQLERLELVAQRQLQFEQALHILCKEYAAAAELRTPGFDDQKLSSMGEQLQRVQED